MIEFHFGPNGTHFVCMNRHSTLGGDGHPIYAHYYLYCSSADTQAYRFGPVDDFGNLVPFN